MAQRGKAISVKVPTARVISALENALVKLTTDYDAQEANEAKYEKAKEVWNKLVLEYAIANYGTAKNVRTSFRSYSNTANIDFDVVARESDFPPQPEKDFDTINSYEYRNQKSEIENAIRILKMTDEETVSTSTYQAVARYL